MNITIKANTNQPIYEQISNQLKSQILSGTLKPGEALPSIRFLAKELKVSVITTKRVYDDLENDGFINTIAGKGSYVAHQDPALLREVYLVQIQEKLEDIVSLRRTADVSVDDVIAMYRLLEDA